MDEDSKNWFKWKDYFPPEEAANFELGSSTLVSKFSFLLTKQAFILESILPSLETPRLALTVPLLMGISSNAKVIITLAGKNFGNEIYAISRSLIERLITFYFLQCCSESEINDYVDYSNQKTVRKMKRSMKINDIEFSLEWSPNLDLDRYPKLKEAFEKFTSKKSKRPINRWTGSSLEEKLAVIDSTKEIDIRILMLAFDTLYDDGSEALHGTLYGCTFHLGFFKPGTKSDTYDQVCGYHRSSLATMFMLLGVLLGDVNQYAAKRCNKSEILDEAKDTNKQILSTLKMMQKKS